MVAIFTGAGAGVAQGSANILGGAGQLGGANHGLGGQQVSVNAATGNLVLSRQDEFLVGLGLDATVSRFYNSLEATSDRDNNDSWQQSSTRRIYGLTGTENTAGSTITRLDADGSVITYTYGTRTELARPNDSSDPDAYVQVSISAYWTTDGSGSHDRIFKSGTQWKWVDGDSQVTETYGLINGSTEYLLVSSTTLGGRTLSYAYKAGTQLVETITTSNGEWLKYHYDASNRITRIETEYVDLHDVDGDANITERLTLSRTWYEYDASGRLSLVRTDHTPSDNTAPTNAQSYYTAYAYNAAGKVSQITQKDGSKVTVDYDGSGRVWKINQEVTTGVFRTTELVYVSATQTNIIAPDGSITQMHYNAAKQLTKIVAPAVGGVSQDVEFAYDVDGNVASTINGDNEQTTYTYDKFGNVETITRPGPGATTIIVQRRYDANNRLLIESWKSTVEGAAAQTINYKRYAYGTASGKLEWEIDATGHVREYVYDSSRRLTNVYEYTAHTYAAHVDDAAVPTAADMATWRAGLGDLSTRKVVTNSYNARGSLTQVRTFGSTSTAGAGQTTPDNYTDTRYTYDTAGNVLTRQTGNETADVMVYDGLHRMTSLVSAATGTTTVQFNDGATTTQVITAGSFVTTKTYNLAGELISHTGRNGGTAQYAYDKQGRLRYTVDESGDKSYTIYDAAGRMTGQVNHHGNVIEYRYDAANRLIATTRYHNTVSTTNLTNLANPDNVLTVAGVRPTPDNTKDIWSWTIYDNAGRVTQTIDGDGGVVAYVYDEAGNLLKTTAYFNKISTGTLITNPPLVDQAVTASATKDAVTRHFYDAAGRRVASLDAEGYLTTVRYDEAGQAVETVAFAKQVTSTLWAAGTLAQLKTDAVENAATNRRTVNVYDAQGVLRYTLAYQERSGTNDLWQVTQFNYANVNGRPTQTIVRANTIAIANASPTFGFAAVKALVTTSTNDRTLTTAYSATTGLVSSTTDHTGLVTAFVYDAKGRVIRTLVGTGVDQRVTRNFYYDNDLLKYQVDPDGYTTYFEYELDGLNKLARRYDDWITTTDSTTRENVDSLVGGTFADTATVYDGADRVITARNGENEASDASYYGTGLASDAYMAKGLANDESRSTTVYTTAGRILNVTAGVGDVNAVTAYLYDGLGRQTQVTDARGKLTTYEYDRRGLLTKVTDDDGGVTQYEYNAFGEVVKTTDARGAITYTYYDELGRVEQVVDALGIATTSTYNRFGDVTAVRRYYTATTGASVTNQPTPSGTNALTQFGYNAKGQLTQTTDAMNYVESYTYNQFGERATVVAKSNVASTTDSSANTTTYTYNKRGLLASVTLPVKSSTNATLFIKTSYTYDARGNRLTMVEADGLTEARTTRYEYDKANRLTKTVAEDLRTVYSQTNHLAVAGTVRPEESYIYDERGNLVAVTDAEGNRSVFYYDDLGRKTAEIDAGGTFTAYTYDANGNVINIKVYDTIKTTIPAEGGSKAEGAAQTPTGVYRETGFQYDDLNRMTKSWVVGVHNGTWNGSAWVANATNFETQYQYDAMGNVVKTIDPMGNATHAYYDLLGRKTAQVDGEGYITTWAYNAEGNVETEIRFATRFTGTVTTTAAPTVSASGKDRKTTYTYDLAGNRLTETRHDVKVHNGSGASVTQNATVTYTYNGLGQVLTRTEAAGDVTTYTYDDGGRLTSEVKPGFTDLTGLTAAPTLTYAYDGLGNLRTLTAAGNTNAVARTTTYAYGAGGLISSVTDAEGKVRQFFYDKLGRQLVEQYQRTESNGTTVHTEASLTSYDKKGQVIAQSAARLVSGAWSKGDITSTAYNAFGDVIATGINIGTSAPSTWQQQNKYDLAGRLWATNSGDGVWKFFGYDKNGNQTIAITSAGYGFTSSTTFQQAFDQIADATNGTKVNATFTVYNARNLATQVVEEQRQLTSSTTATITTGRTYNAFGETETETSASGAVLTYTYNTMGKVTRSIGPAVEMTNEAGVKVWIRPTQDFYYDKSGRLVAQRDANGTYSTTANTQGTAYVKGDDTGNLTLLTLLAGSGYNGSEALVAKQVNADGGVTRTSFDIHGNARKTEVLVTGTEASGTWRTTTRTFDKLGRVLTQTGPAGLVDTFAYDELGQRTQHWNSFLVTGQYYDPTTKQYYGGTPDTETTDYDMQGRVISTRAFGGDVTTTTYVWSGTIAATGTGLTNTGGWTQTTTMANSKTLVQKTDIFGRATQKTDLGGHVTNYTYDVSGRLLTAAIGSASYNYTYFNTGQLATSSTIDTVWYSYGDYYGGWYTYSTTTTQGAAYTYDVAGNRLTEYGTTVNGSTVVWKNNTATYDLLGRLVTINAAATSAAPAAQTSFEYDANGNIRKKTSSFYLLDATGVAAASQTTQTGWYRYDAMNRVVINNGTLTGGQIVRRPFQQGSGVYVWETNRSHEFAYNKAGDRTSQAITNAVLNGKTWTFTYNEVKELYSYDNAGRLIETREAVGTSSTSTTPPAATGTGTLRATYSYDAMGRQLTQNDYDNAGTTVQYSSTNTYNAKGQLATQNGFTIKTDNKTYTTNTTFDYGTGTAYALGSVVSSTASSRVNTGSWTNSSTTNTYGWWDSAVQTGISHDSNTGSNSNPIWTTSFTLNGLGQMTVASINDGKPRSVTFSLDEIGQIIRRDETRPSNAPAAQTGSPHEVWYRIGDREWGYTGNNGSEDVTMAESLGQRRYYVDPAYAGTFRNSATASQAHSDFARSVDPLNSYYQGSSSGSHTVKSGDTLQGLAQSLYGDSSLWYKIAEANGLSGASSLTPGQQIQLPAGVTRNTFNAGTFTPYDPGQAIGDLSPTTGAPPKKPKCGVFGMILLAAIAIAVAAVAGPALIGAAALGTAGTSGFVAATGLTAMLGGTAAAAGSLAAISAGVIGGAIAGAAGSIVSQAVGVAAGIQEKFSWKAVGMAAIGGGVGGGLSASGLFGSAASGAFRPGAIAIKSGIVDAAVKGVTSNVLTQGIGVATGLQKSFDWTGVAAAGVGGAVGYIGGRALNVRSFDVTRSLDNVVAQSLNGTARALAMAATRSAIEGSSFGDNLMRSLPDAIGQTVGDLVAAKVNGASLEKQVERLVNSEDLPAELRGTETTELFARHYIFSGRSFEKALESLRSPDVQSAIFALSDPDFVENGDISFHSQDRQLYNDLEPYFGSDPAAERNDFGYYKRTRLSHWDEWVARNDPHDLIAISQLWIQRQIVASGWSREYGAVVFQNRQNGKIEVNGFRGSDGAVHFRNDQTSRTGFNTVAIIHGHNTPYGVSGFMSDRSIEGPSPPDFFNAYDSHRRGNNTMYIVLASRTGETWGTYFYGGRAGTRSILTEDGLDLYNDAVHDRREQQRRRADGSGVAPYDPMDWVEHRVDRWSGVYEEPEYARQMRSWREPE